MSYLRRGILVLGIVFALGGCSGSQTDTESADAGSPENAVATTGSTDVDQSPTPPPGTANAVGTLLSCEQGEPTLCKIRIEKVVGYGASTPPVATGERTVSLRPAVLNDWSIEDLLAGGAKSFTLRHSGDTPQLGESADRNKSPTWALIEISK